MQPGGALTGARLSCDCSPGSCPGSPAGIRGQQTGSGLSGRKPLSTGCAASRVLPTARCVRRAGPLPLVTNTRRSGKPAVAGPRLVAAHLHQVAGAQVARREDRPRQLVEDAQIVLELVHGGAALQGSKGCRVSRQCMWSPRPFQVSERHRQEDAEHGGRHSQHGGLAPPSLPPFPRSSAVLCPAAKGPTGEATMRASAHLLSLPTALLSPAPPTSQRAKTEPLSQACGFTSQSFTSPHRLHVKRSCGQQGRPATAR